MKNLLIENLKAKMEAEKTAAEEERLNNLPEASLQDDMKAVSKHRLNVVEVDDVPVGGSNGELWTIVDGKPIFGKSQEELEATKDRMSRGIHGDGYLYKELDLDGNRVVCKGRTEEELNADILAAKEFAATHRNTSWQQAAMSAVTFVGANYKPEDVEEVEVLGYTVYIIYPQKFVVDGNFEIMANLSEITSELNKQDIKTLLVHKVEDIIKNYHEDVYDEDDYEDDEDYYDDDYDEEEDIL